MAQGKHLSPTRFGESSSAFAIGRPPELGSFSPEWGHNEIDFWYGLRDIVGVEVYHVPSQIPRDLRRFSEPHCGMINDWTRNRW